MPAASACLVGTAAQKDRVASDMTEWRNLLLGSAEVSGGDKVGAVLGARGCVVKDAATDIYQVTIAWQGGGATAAPPAGITCGQGLYGDDAARRAVSLTVQISKFT